MEYSFMGSDAFMVMLVCRDGKVLGPLASKDIPLRRKELLVKRDASIVDASVVDTSVVDTSVVDASVVDANVVDASVVDFVITSDNGWIPIERYLNRDTGGVSLGLPKNTGDLLSDTVKQEIVGVPWGWLIALAAVVGAFVFFVWRGLTK